MAQSLLLADHTYMKVGGPADEIIEVKSTHQLTDAINSLRRQQKRFYVLGSGSNTIFSDQGFRGTVILNQARAFRFDTSAHTLTADSGCMMNFLVHQAVAHNLSGLEWYLGLPGTLGGAIYNNSHFQKHLIEEVIKSVKILTKDFQETELFPEDLDFSYDYSRFQHSEEIILSAVLQLSPADGQQVKQTASASLKFRADHQPLSVPSSGSFFKNPAPDMPAGALIDQAGLKNTSIGGAMVSPVHANFIINTGHATANDIQQLAAKIQSVVSHKFNVKLEPEVIFINEFGERV